MHYDVIKDTGRESPAITDDGRYYLGAGITCELGTHFVRIYQDNKFLVGLSVASTPNRVKQYSPSTADKWELQVAKLSVAVGDLTHYFSVIDAIVNGEELTAAYLSWPASIWHASGCDESEEVFTHKVARVLASTKQVAGYPTAIIRPNDTSNDLYISSLHKDLLLEQLRVADKVNIHIRKEGVTAGKPVWFTGSTLSTTAGFVTGTTGLMLNYLRYP